jgi:hypothetical protein
MNMAGVTYAVVLQRLLLYSTHQVWHGFDPLLLQLVVARVLGLATPESILLANFGGEREESNL